ncbi:MAG: hypothetical protein ACE5HX_13475 [bacterium]
MDTSGYLYNPLAVTVYGYWVWERVAELLPFEYSSHENLNQFKGRELNGNERN